MIHLSREAAADVVRVREFLSAKNPDAAKRALRQIFAALEKVYVFPSLGKPTEDPDIRQIVVPFGSAGYIVRHTVRPGSGNVLALRIWSRGADIGVQPYCRRNRQAYAGAAELRTETSRCGEHC